MYLYDTHYYNQFISEGEGFVSVVTRLFLKKLSLHEYIPVWCGNSYNCSLVQHSSKTGRQHSTLRL